MEQKENAVKAAEQKIRREHDYTNVLTYLQSVSSLHGVEREGRNYLIGEVEMCRAKVRSDEERRLERRPERSDSKPLYRRPTYLTILLTLAPRRFPTLRRAWLCSTPS